MAKLLESGQYECVYCGLKSPKNHWNSKAWIDKHEKNCPRHPDHNKGAA